MVKLRLFASIREAAGTGSTEFAGATVGDIIDAACAAYGEHFTALVGTCAMWINGEPAERTDAVSAGDEVALLPPVSGG